jgi:hypothetical protein
MEQFKNLITVFISLLIFSSCSKKVYPTSPTLENFPLKIVEKKSQINIPISFDIEPIEKMADKELPKRFWNGDAWETEKNVRVAIVFGQKIYKDFQYRYDGTLTPINLEIFNDKLTLKTSLNYWAEVRTRFITLWYASCGKNEQLRQLNNVGFTANLNITSDWKLASNVTALPVSAGNRCLLTKANFDVTNKIIDALQPILNKQADKLESEIQKKVNLKEKLTSIWETIQIPYNASENVWFNLNPQNLYLTDFKNNNKILNFSIGLTANPSIKYSQTEPPISTHPLPNLEKPKDIYDGSNILISAGLSFNDATNLIKPKIQKAVYKFGLRKIIVEDVKISGIGKNIVLELKVKGCIKGTLYFVGQPIYDPLRREMLVTSFDYSIETNNIIANVADWIIHSNFRTTINNYLVFSLGEKIDDAVGNLNKSLNRELSSNVSMTGNIENISPLGIYVDNENERFDAYVDTFGHIQISVK